MSPEKLIERILSGEFDADDFWNLCGHFHKGYPIDHIQPILRSDNLETLSAAAFYANELGPLLRPYVKELTRLLAHPSAQARSDAIHGLKQCITDKDTDAMARIIFALDDPDPFVHRSVMSYLQHAGNNSAIYAAAKVIAHPLFAEFRFVLKVAIDMDVFR